MNLKAILNIPITFMVWFTLATMTINLILSEWTLDPIHDIFFTLTIGPVFPKVHASSMAFVLGATYLMAYRKKSLGMGLVLGFSSAALHEFILAGFSLAFLGWQEVLGGFYPLGLGVVLALAIWKGSKADRKTMFMIGLLMASFDWFLFLNHIGTPWSPPLVNDVLAVALWGLSCLPWFLPQKWLSK